MTPKPQKLATEPAPTQDETAPRPRGFRYQDIIGLWPDLDEGFEDYVKELRKDRRQREVL